MYPYLDAPGYRDRTIIPSDFIDELETNRPGWVELCLFRRSSWMHGRFRKRYGAAADGNALPFGQQPPIPLATGTAPPALTLIGRPTLGSMLLLFQVKTAGALGTALFQWSKNRGKSFEATNVQTGANVVLAGTGLVAQFAATGPFSTDNVYTCDPPVPEIILGWLVAFTDLDVMRTRYRQTNDPELDDFKAAAQAAADEVKEAADGKDGLFDLPVTEGADSAVTTGGPRGYSEASPYAWTTQQAQSGTYDDLRGRGS